MSVSIRNERVKLTAQALDRVSTACVAIGVFAPLAAGLLDKAIGPLAIAALGGWLAAAIMLHIVAR
jgi:hypothetical protein